MDTRHFIDGVPAGDLEQLHTVGSLPSEYPRIEHPDLDLGMFADCPVYHIPDNHHGLTLWAPLVDAQGRLWTVATIQCGKGESEWSINSDLRCALQWRGVPLRLMAYSLREGLKGGRVEGTVVEKLQQCIAVMAAHYARSAESANGSGHPDFGEYASAYLYGQDRLAQVDDDVRGELRRMFPPKNAAELRKGTYWEVAGYPV